MWWAGTATRSASAAAERSFSMFKEAAAWFSGRIEVESARHVRSVRLEEKYRKQTPELVWSLSVDDFAALAALAMTPKEIPVVGLDLAGRSVPRCGREALRPDRRSRGGLDTPAA